MTVCQIFSAVIFMHYAQKRKVCSRRTSLKTPDIRRFMELIPKKIYANQLKLKLFFCTVWKLMVSLPKNVSKVDHFRHIIYNLLCKTAILKRFYIALLLKTQKTP